MESTTEISKDQVKVKANKNGLRCSDVVLRFTALTLTLVAAIVLGVAKETKLVPVQVVSTLPPLNVPASAKWHHLSAFVYFVVANAIASAYAASSLVVALATRGGKKNMSLVLTVLDLVMVALLFSCNGATTAVGVIGYEGNTHVRWNKVCNVFDKFCHQVAAAIVLSLLASLAFLWLVVLSAMHLHKKHD